MTAPTYKPKKRCSKCQRLQLLSAYGVSVKQDRDRPRKVRNSWCNRCKYAANKVWYDRHPELLKKYARRSALKCRYGLSEDQYEAMLRQQNGVCAVCLRPPKARRLAVDHDHYTGLVRGLLCMGRDGCNRAVIGRRREPELFERAATYLRHPPGVPGSPNHIVPLRRRKQRKLA